MKGGLMRFFLAGEIAGFLGGTIICWLYSRPLPVVYSFSAFVYGAIGGISAAIAGWVLSRLLRPGTVLRVISTVWIATFSFLVLVYWGNKSLLAGVPFNASKSILYDAGALLASILVGWGLGTVVRPIFSGNRRVAVLAGSLLLLPIVHVSVALERTKRGQGLISGQQRRSVLLISIDTMRADRLSCYGYDRSTTPTIDSLAANGVRFEAAYCPVPATGPSHATMLTGLDVYSHAVFANGYKLASSCNTLAELLSEAGYATGGFVTNPVIGRRFGFQQGFDIYVESGHVEQMKFVTPRFLFRALTFVEGIRKLRYRYENGEDQTLSATKGWLREVKDRPFFLFFHLVDPHAPYVPLGKFRTMFPPEPDRIKDGDWTRESKDPEVLARMESFYEGEIAQSDWKIRELFSFLRELGRDENLIVILTSDHGENLGDHEPFFRHERVYESVLQVPLIFSFSPVLPSGKTIQTPIENRDIAPTLLSLLHIAPPASLDGRDLTALMLGEEAGNPENVVTAMHGKRHSLRIGRYKLIYDEVAEESRLFDLDRDPHEQEDLSAEFPDITGKLVAALRSMLQKRESDENALEEGQSRMEGTDPQTRERLRALGYIE